MEKQKDDNNTEYRNEQVRTKLFLCICLPLKDLYSLIAGNFSQEYDLRPWLEI